MEHAGGKGRVRQFGLDGPSAIRIVRRIAADSANVVFTRHAVQRLKQRRITRPEAIECLRKGLLIEGPAPGTGGSWEMKFERAWGGATIAVGGALEWDGDFADRVIVVT